MAKVMVSLPDDLLARLDANAAERGTTRSGALRELAESALGQRAQLLAERMRSIGDHATTGHGGNVADVVKAARPG